MGLSVYLNVIKPVAIYSNNITHNLAMMADEAGIYEALWRPDEVGITKASQLIEPLTKGLNALLKNSARFKEYNSPNGWGTYEGLVDFVRGYLDACIANPDSDVEAER